LSLLSEEEMKELKELLSLNAISDIIHWCENLTEQKPELAPLADKISQTAKSFDLKKLRQLLNKN